MTLFSVVVCINIIVQDMWPVQRAFASLAAFRHILVFNCYSSCLFYVVLENKINDDDDTRYECYAIDVYASFCP